MLVKVLSSSYLGIEPFLVEVEVDITNGLPIFTIVGLGDTVISESRDRIRSAIKNMGYNLEPKRIVVNLTPANMRKVGSHFDLPIAVGVMVGMRLVKDYTGILNRYMFIGELSLTGKIRRSHGVISGVLLAKELGYEGIVIPTENLKEASIIEGIKIIPADNLRDVMNFLQNEKVKEYKVPKMEENFVFDIDMSDVKGQEKAKRAIEISAAGGHNLIMVGAPGCGKSMLAKRISTILPEMNEKEIIETTKIYSISGGLNESKPIINKRPFRMPHHTTTSAAVIGGGKVPRPGEISLANNGVLFMDEFVEFPKDVIESLREPLEERKVSITRSMGKVEFPANFIFVAACNPCPCGFSFDDDKCNCSSFEIRRYAKKLSGPIIDRIDLYIEIRRLSEEEMINLSNGEKSLDIKERVKKARDIQIERFGDEKLNGYMSNKDLEKYCHLDSESEKIMRGAIRSLNLSMRAFNKVLKVARTIADLENCKIINKIHLMEALAFRKN
ncbi:YifB family Mg chelatase-like AAA ATPase [Cetobacterium sp. 2A]|uniref:YifB family Mg chelatase-like AAA ATPase n=1 Tax=Cetobacterium sp. 2A TaxID=2754723 RepID=UPI00163C01E7|nr:YifB family Mg chelatase-like AAA ATPase [Cetobacterium sp. 2A]MBC2855986.1 YifB family Mg chelatase-like AAA ATPase [Cetobacterium sp. 2A]